MSHNALGRRMSMAHVGAVAGRFRRNASGVAVVEFALILPLLILLYFGSIEASSLYTVDRRVTVIAGTVGDLIARWDPGSANTPIPEGTFTSYFAAANVIMRPYGTGALQQVVSLIYIDPAGAATVMWSRATGTGAAPRTTNSSYPLAATAQLNQMARGTTGGYLVVAEVYNLYKPVLGLVFNEALNLSHASFFLPRFGDCLRVVTGGVTSACPV